MIFFYLSEGMENCEISEKSQGILRWMISGNPALCIKINTSTQRWLILPIPEHLSVTYRIFPAIRRGFRPSRMTSNNLTSPMKFCYNTNSTLPKQCQSSRSVLQDGSRTLGLFWKEKKTRLITEEIRYMYRIYLAIRGGFPSLE